ncbi:MAG: zinc ribbon domain-containing protein [Methanosarcinaceae archaeon]|nr:zinc ribbon domain-containing protein [Methanosarcinaceae archaeon]
MTGPKFCNQCGSSLKQGVKFCANCGSKVLSLPEQHEPNNEERIHSNPSPSGQVRFVYGNLKKKKSLGRWDNFTLVATNDKLIFALTTSEMLKRVASEAKERAKKEGKGLFGKWGAVMSSASLITDRYLGMEPDNILNETKGNFELSRSHLRSIKVNFKPIYNGVDDETPNSFEHKISFKTIQGDFDFISDNDPSHELAGFFGNIVN